MTSTFQRQPLAVMFTDIKGYTSLTSKDEMLALSLVDKKRLILQSLLKKHKGTFVKEMGDGTVTYFKDPSQATDCAIKLQEQTHDDENLNIRIGIHYGDTIIKNKDVFGDTVNIASRIESLAIAGGVFISKEARDKIKKPHDDVSLGLQTMKGVGRLIEVYGLKGKQLSIPNPKDYEETKISVHSDDEVPSIAIIPFKNKGKKDDEFYAYGISADLITDVTSAGLIRVASKKLIEDAGNLPQDELAKKLDVRYMANGELWRMGDMFQLSVELYDTKDKKVVWSDRWQEKWDDLPAIKINLSDGLLKALDTTSKVEKQVETTNPEAYEYYLRGKHKYEKRENSDDTEIARGLIQKAMELDDKLIIAKLFLGHTYTEMGEYDNAIKIYTSARTQAKDFDDKRGMGISLNSIGAVYYYKGDYDTALDYYGRSLAIHEELDDKLGIGYSLLNIGIVHASKGDYDTALDYYKRSLAIREELGDKRGMGISLNSIGAVYYYKGDYDTALDYYGRSLAIKEEIGDKRGIGYSLNHIGTLHRARGDYDKAEEYLEKSLGIQKEIGLKSIELETTTALYLCYKHLDKEYDVKKIHSLIKGTEHIEFELNLPLYELLEDKSYLETAYNQVQEKASAMKEGLKAKFLSYPIPKAIIEEYNKLFKS